ncbi:MAG: hypothetical protein ACRD2R_04405 [Terriglobales bacterium]
MSSTTTSANPAERAAAKAPVAAPQPLAKSTALSVGALSIALAEGVCAALVFLKGIALFSGLMGLMAAGASSWFHRDWVRIQLLVLASAVALANLYLLWNAWRLRNAPAARWRRRPLHASERRQVAFLLLSSLVTLLLVAAEVYGHSVLGAS